MVRARAELIVGFWGLWLTFGVACSESSPEPAAQSTAQSGAGKAADSGAANPDDIESRQKWIENLRRVAGQ